MGLMDSSSIVLYCECECLTIHSRTCYPRVLDLDLAHIRVSNHCLRPRFAALGLRLPQRRSTSELCATASTRSLLRFGYSLRGGGTIVLEGLWWARGLGLVLRERSSRGMRGHEHILPRPNNIISAVYCYPYGVSRYSNPLNVMVYVCPTSE